jgi:hypothetical protein
MRYPHENKKNQGQKVKADQQGYVREVYCLVLDRLEERSLRPLERPNDCHDGNCG